MDSISFIVALLLLLSVTSLLLREAKHTVRLPARYESIRSIQAVMARFANQARLGDQDVFEFRVALDEACVNIIEHAYENDPTGEIEVNIQTLPGMCAISLTDFGQPFDPRSVPHPMLGIPLEDMKPGGLGLHLMRKMADEVSYTVGRESNTLLMVKRRSE